MTNWTLLQSTKTIVGVPPPPVTPQWVQLASIGTSISPVIYVKEWVELKSAAIVISPLTPTRNWWFLQSMQVIILPKGVPIVPTPPEPEVKDKMLWVALAIIGIVVVASLVGGK